MFVILAKFLSPLLYPLGWSLALWGLALAAYACGRHKAAGWAATAGAAVVLLASNPLLSDALVGTLEDDYAALLAAEAPSADAIVVLGGLSLPPIAPRVHVEAGAAVDRLLYGVRLWKADKAPYMLLSGGVISSLVGSDMTEGQRLRDLALLCGVDEEALVLEEDSRDTYENALYSAQIARSRGWSRLLLVTSAAHMRRAVAVFRAQGMHVLPAPADLRAVPKPLTMRRFMPQARALENTTAALHEYIGLLAYAARGRL